MSGLDIDAVADELLAAYRSGKTLPPLTSTFAGLTVDDAYAIQRRQADTRTNAGARIVGFKVGLTSAAMQQQLGVDLQGVLAAAQDVLRPIVPRMPFADRSAIVQGYAGVYSSFLLHAERASERYGVAAHEILQRVGEAGYVGGQEDMIIDIAIQLAQQRGSSAGGS